MPGAGGSSRAIRMHGATVTTCTDACVKWGQISALLPGLRACNFLQVVTLNRRRYTA